MIISPEIAKLLKFTDNDVAKWTFLLQGPPRCGKTALAGKLCQALVGPDETFVLDWPEEEGTSTLADAHIPYQTMTSQSDLDLWYPRVVKMQPKAIVWDGLPSSYNLFMREKVPSGNMPEDHGKTWMSVATTLRREIVRFKMIPSVECFVVTSHVWADKDEITQKEGRLQITLPGQLKSNLYGLFSYNILIEMEDNPDGHSKRVLKLLPTARYVAGVRVPVGVKIPPRVPYDLADSKGAGPILDALHFVAWKAEEKK